MEDVKVDGITLLANYVDLYPAPTALPAQEYTFEITASVTDGQSIAETFTWTLTDPCLNSMLITVEEQTDFTDDYSGTS